MGTYKVNRPEEAAMRRLLEKNPANPAGAILRLAWRQGLLREEITNLTWDQVSFLDRQIVLPERSVPFGEGMEDYLRSMHDRWAHFSEYVVFSERYRKQMQPQAISRIARRVLDGEGQTAVRLIDLRHDYIIRQIEENDWVYAAQITGMEIRTLQIHFSGYIRHVKKSPARREPPQVDEFKLWKVLQTEKNTPAGLALWLTWQMGLTGNEIISITWDQVDFGENVIHLADRDAPLSSAVRRMLLDRRQDQAQDSHVFLSANAKKPVDISRLSRIVRAALIRGGIDDMTLRDLFRSSDRSGDEAVILEQVRRRGAISRRDVMRRLDLTGSAAYGRLRRMTDEKKLVRVGGKYYLPGTVVPPEEQTAVIREYLAKAGFAYRQDIADILHVQDRQCSAILKHLVEAGEIVQIRQKYYLKEA